MAYLQRVRNCFKMIRGYMFLTSLLIICAVVAASLTPGSWRPQTPMPTTVEHLIAYTLVAFWFALILPGVRTRIACVLALMALAGAMELVQTLIPSRRGQLVDFSYSAAGVSIGSAVGILATSLFERLRKSTAHRTRVCLRPSLTFVPILRRKSDRVVELSGRPQTRE